nr:hypothetical protein [Streptomyces sp. 846.5]
MPESSSSDRIIGSAQFSVAFFATILTGEAVIFAITFSASSSWPSMREIDEHIAFREWVVIGWLGATLLGVGLLVPQIACATAGAVLFLLADLLGLFSFVRLFNLAGVTGRRRLLRRTLEQRLEALGGTLSTARARQAEDPVLAGYTRELDGAMAAGDGNSVRDRVAELTGTRPSAHGAEARAALHLEVLYRLCRTALAGTLDSVVAARCAQDLIDSLRRQIDAARPGPPPAAGRTPRGQIPPGLAPDRAAALAGQLCRYLAWLASTALTLSVRQVAPPTAARELVALAVRARDVLLLTLDPDPVTITSSRDLGTTLAGPLGVIVWLRQFVEFHGSAQAAAFYPTFEVLTGTKFQGNYWDGASILTELRDALYGPAARAATPEAERSRAAFGAVEDFDRLWIWLSVAALATLRDTRAAHPPELIRPEFNPDRRLLRAYLRSFASHRPFTTAQDAHTALLTALARAEPPSGLWSRSTALLNDCYYPVALPVIEPQQRIAATILAIACRLAPLHPGGDEQELRTFLGDLPTAVLGAVHRLVQRSLPAPAAATGSGPVDDIVQRLTILHLPATTITGPATVPSARTP